MKECYLCDNRLTDLNRSKEHIILNSIGGRLKSSDLLCKKCNSELGHNADTELANQLSFLSNLIQVKRDSGKNQIIKGGKTKDGKEYYIKEGGKPILAKPEFNVNQVGNETQYSISARSEKELIDIMKGLKKKHPQLDLDEVKKNFQWKEEYLNESLNFNETIGGDLAFQSITKTAVNYYIINQKEKSNVQHLFDYLKGKENLNVSKHFYPKKSIYKKCKGEIIHLIHLNGNKHTKVLYCFIEFFSAYSFVVLLSDNYNGKNCKITYAYDLVKNKEVKKNVKLKLDKNELNDLLNLSKNDFKIIQQKLKRVLNIVDKKQTDQEISNIVKRSIDKISKKYKNEPKMTKQMYEEFVHDVSLAYVKFAYKDKAE